MQSDLIHMQLKPEHHITHYNVCFFPWKRKLFSPIKDKVIINRRHSAIFYYANCWRTIFFLPWSETNKWYASSIVFLIIKLDADDIASKYNRWSSTKILN